MGPKRADVVREQLEQCIVHGEFKNGDRLDEVSLAERFGVSRTPFREALQALAGSGLVELIPRRGCFVRHPGIVELVEMFEVMAEWEALCGRLAARKATTGNLVDLTFAAKACEDAFLNKDSDAYYRENEKFHRVIYKASSNGFLASEAERLQKRLRPYRRMQLRVDGRMKQSMEEHREILDAIRNGDSDAAGKALRSHVVVQGEKFHSLMENLEKKLSDTKRVPMNA